MKKLILGIVLVGIIQFAFVVYTQLQAPLKLDVAAVQFEAAPLTVAPPNISDPAPSYEPVKISDNSGLRSASQRSGANTSAVKRSKRINSEFAAKTYGSKFDSVNFTQQKPARSKDLTSLAVSYRDSRPAADRDCPDDEIRPKRSFVAKAAPVVKKPWEWIKALGSKFN
jgi:hypothetical protein